MIFENAPFEHREVLPGVFLMRDPMGVCMTLLRGSREALLVDTGYGLGNARRAAETLAKGPLRVLLTHGHHDHALGALDFDSVLLSKEDREVYRTYTGRAWRERVLAQAAQKGFLLGPEQEKRYLGFPVPAPESIGEMDLDLGGMTARVLPCPGHTPGSLLVYVPERKLLLTGDNWNPCTWLFFPEALGARGLRDGMRRFLELDFDYALCGHSFALEDAGRVRTFFDGLTDTALEGASSCPEGDRVGKKTRRALLPKEQIFVFDWDKYQAERGAGDE